MGDTEYKQDVSSSQTETDCSGGTRDYDFGQYASRIAAAQSAEDVWQILEMVCKKAEIDGVCCRCFPNQAIAEPVIFFSKTDGFNNELEAALQAAPGYLDSFLHASMRTTKPFVWRDVDRLLDPRSPQAVHFREKIKGLGTGVIVPVFGPLFRHGYYCFHVQEPRAVTELDMMVLHSIAQTAYLKLLDLMYQSSGQERTLSGRELEAINNVARGKSNQEVAEAMAVSVNTINTLLKRIFDKLDVTDRVSAVMRAYALGYIG